jgi:hypothetical protein
MEVFEMSSSWKSDIPTRWEPKADQFLLDLIKRYPKETHMDLARKILDDPLIKGRSLGAVEQRIGWMRAKLREA